MSLTLFSLKIIIFTDSLKLKDCHVSLTVTDYKKSSKSLHLRIWNQTVFLEKWPKWLIDSENSWGLTYFGLGFFSWLSQSRNITLLLTEYLKQYRPFLLNLLSHFRVWHSGCRLGWGVACAGSSRCWWRRCYVWYWNRRRRWRWEGHGNVHE